jgi:O-antigen biosynthesis protein
MSFDNPQYKAHLARRIANLLPGNFSSVIWRQLNSASRFLPYRMQQRLRRFAASLSRDMGAIERDYGRWIACYDLMDDATRQSILSNIAAMSDPPLISIVMPVYNPAPGALRIAIESVQAQLYPRWELCIADDVSTNPAVGVVLAEKQADDERIKIVQRQQNGHISAASNSALALATGSFVALMDHDDILPPHALYEIATRVVSNSEIDILYSDEDHIDDAGQRCHPYFKPDWDPELLSAQNLISHLGVYRRVLLEQVGGFRLGFEGSQDHDLALRVAAISRPNAIVHIPKILYHWRQGTTEQTFSETARERCIVNARRAVAEHVGPDSSVEPARRVPMWSRVVHAMPDVEPLVSIILDRNGAGVTTQDYVARLKAATAYSSIEVVHADSSSEVSSSSKSSDHSSRTLEDAARIARGSMVLFLQADFVPVERNWLREMVSQALRPEIGVVGAKLLDPNGLIVHAGIALGGANGFHMPYAGCRDIDVGYFGHLQLVRTVSAASIACMMVRRRTLQNIGGLNTALVGLPLGIDLCLRLGRNGLRTLWTPYAALRRVSEGGNDLKRGPEAKRTIRLPAEWRAHLKVDPYWNPNLAAVEGPPQLAFPSFGFPIARVATEQRPSV